MTRSRKSMSLGDAVERVLRRADPGGKRHSARAVSAWNEVVGPEIAKRTRGFALREHGELVVFVDAPAWANQLSLMAEDLRVALNTHLGQETVRSIRFTVSKNVSRETQWQATEAEADAFYEVDVDEPSPLDEREREQAECIARAVKDPELRALALRVMIKDLELKKGRRESAGQRGRESGFAEPGDGAS